MRKIEPDSVSIIKKTAYCFYLLGDYTKAIKYYKTAVESEPVNADTHYSIGLMYHYLNDVKNAFKYYNNALSVNPKYFSALNNIGLLYYETKDYESALKADTLKYGEFFDVYSQGVMEFGTPEDEEFALTFKAFLRDSVFHEVYTESLQVFDDVSDIEKKLTEMFGDKK